MDDRENNPSIHSGTTTVKTTVRNLLLGSLAIITVVFAHLGIPLFFTAYVATLQFTLAGILLFLLSLLLVLFAPLEFSIFSLKVIEKGLPKETDFTVSTWPWLITIPSVLFLILVATSPLLSGLLFAPNSVLTALRTPHWNTASWIVVIVAIIMVINGFASGAIRDFSGNVTDSGDPKNQEQISETHRNHYIPQHGIYNWQRPPDIGFEDIGGLDEEKDHINRRVLYPILNRNDAYERFRVTPPTGILLYGPPGTGKTYFARAIAGELNAPYLELSHADLASMWINESSSNVQTLFEETKLLDYCVIFIDEIDGLLPKRNAKGNHEDQKIVSEFLARLSHENPNYLIIAATNRPDQLDSAVLRPGRFDEHFEIGLPSTQDREEILKVQLRGREPSLTDSQYRTLAAQTEGLTAADIANIVDRAALRAAERDAPTISYTDITKSLEI